MTLRSTLLRSRIVSTSRNIVLGERFDSRTYLTRYGERYRVSTICEMEFVKREVRRAK